MAKVMEARLTPASGGFGEYDWVEAVEVEGAEDGLDYEAMLNDAGLSWERTDELSGRIHREIGPVYKFGQGDDAYYAMAWVEE